ncbi:MAG TPA: hypothetical protein V6C85_13465 [Allocoleopsis sp.]
MLPSTSYCLNSNYRGSQIQINDMSDELIELLTKLLQPDISQLIDLKE